MLRTLLSGQSQMGIVDIIIYVISSLVVIFLTMPVHEFAHAFAAVKLGDKTPKYQGRLSLNPFAHIDYLGALSILVLGFGWAKPVQIDHRNLKKPKRDMALIALAGPMSNLLMAFLSLTFYHMWHIVFDSFYIGSFFYDIAVLNIYLAVYNLIPVPPFDGSRILFAFLPNKYYYGIMKYERYLLIAVLVLSYAGVLSVPLNYLSNWVFSGFYFLSRMPFNFIGLLLG